jgi:hypothetical protein
MERKVLSLGIVAGLLLWGVAGTVFAGIAPSPFQPEINKLHSIELNQAAIDKRLDKLQSPAPLPNGTANYLDATVNHLGVLDTRLADVLNALPDPVTPYPGIDEVILSLDGIRTDASSSMDLFENIYSRLGIAPSPFREVLGNIIERATEYIKSFCIPNQSSFCLPVN